MKSGLYVANTGNNRIRKITPAGKVSTLAGSSSGFTDENGMVGAQFSVPYGITVDRDGNFYVANTGNNRIQKLTLE